MILFYFDTNSEFKVDPNMINIEIEDIDFDKLTAWLHKCIPDGGIPVTKFETLVNDFLQIEFCKTIHHKEVFVDFDDLISILCELNAIRVEWARQALMQWPTIHSVLSSFTVPERRIYRHQLRCKGN